MMAKISPINVEVAVRAARNDRLYGLPHAEELFSTIEDCYESAIDCDEPQDEWTVEEWTVAPPGSHLPSADDMLAHLLEWATECACDYWTTEDWSESFQREIGDGNPYTRSLMRRIRNDIVSRITYRMADTKVAEHKITFDADNNPLLNGQPLYVDIAVERSMTVGGKT